MRGQPRPIEYGGKRYPSHMAFSRAFGINPRNVGGRLDRYHVTGERLVARFAMPRKNPRMARTPTSPMYVRTYINGWREWRV